MENKKQSSVDWLKDELEELFISTPYLNWDAIFNKAKQMHKEEVETAYGIGAYSYTDTNLSADKIAKKSNYYNETFIE